jgi:signal transduction histidine kinase
MRTDDGPEDVLVVDDDQEGRAAYAQLLADARYAVRLAQDGRTCLAEVSRAAPALILLDVSMPGMDGLETLRRLRAGPHHAVPVVLVTGSRIDPESIGSGLELGAEEYLQKPVRPAELIARVRALLKIAAMRRELEALRRDHTAMLVHDLKQPLAIIALRAEFIVDEGGDEEMVRSGQAIREAVRQMERLIESVLELSRLEAGQLKLERQPGEIDEVVDEVVGQLRGLAERRGISLTGACAAAHTPVLIDRAKIVQVLQNLLGNALKFTPAGGTIEVRTAVAGRELSVTVEDSGSGLPAGDAARLFDKWHQSGSGRAKGGTGLGLAIARAIVEAHGGRIGASNRDDGQRGARFWFVLPRLSPELRTASG